MGFRHGPEARKRPALDPRLIVVRREHWERSQRIEDALGLIGRANRDNPDNFARRIMINEGA